MQRQNTAAKGATILLFRVPAEPNLDFITTALSRANANRAGYARTSKRIVRDMSQVSRCAAEIGRRADLLVEKCRD
jgi:hypothetical protein